MHLAPHRAFARPVASRALAPRAAPLRASQPRRRTLAARAEAGDKDDKKEERKKKEVQEYVEALEKGGMKKEMAREVLKQWEAAGGDPKSLRKLFLRQSAVPALATTVQTLVDAAAAYSISTSAVFFAAGPDFTGRGVLVFLLNALSAYFALGVVFDVATLVTILISTARIGTSIDSFYSALKTVAGGAGGGSGAAPTGLAVLDKAAAAASAVKVAQALDAIAKMLDGAAAGGGGGKGKGSDTLANLSAYLTLYRSEQRDGFEPSKVGMSESEASDLALRFSEYDLNDDGRLDAAEVRAMAAKLGIDLSAEDAAAAIQAMDRNSDGLIEFSEWAGWWAGRRKG